MAPHGPGKMPSAEQPMHHRTGSRRRSAISRHRHRSRSTSYVAISFHPLHSRLTRRRRICLPHHQFLPQSCPLPPLFQHPYQRPYHPQLPHLALLCHQLGSSRPRHFVKLGKTSSRHRGWLSTPRGCWARATFSPWKGRHSVSLCDTCCGAQRCKALVCWLWSTGLRLRMNDRDVH